MQNNCAGRILVCLFTEERYFKRTVKTIDSQNIAVTRFMTESYKYDS